MVASSSLHLPSGLPRRLTTLLLTARAPYEHCPATADRPAVLCFPGTRTRQDVADDLCADARRWPPRHPAAASVHRGFAQRTAALFEEGVADDFGEADDAAPTMDRLAALLVAEPDVVFTGHSAGGASAVLAASWLAHARGVRPAAVVTFGAPRFASRRFGALYAEQGLARRTRRYAVARDVVTGVPPWFEHVGELVVVPCAASSSPLRRHSLECYAEALA